GLSDSAELIDHALEHRLLMPDELLEVEGVGPVFLDLLVPQHLLQEAQQLLALLLAEREGRLRRCTHGCHVTPLFGCARQRASLIRTPLWTPTRHSRPSSQRCKRCAVGAPALPANRQVRMEEGRAAAPLPRPSFSILDPPLQSPAWTGPPSAPCSLSPARGP